MEQQLERRAAIELRAVGRRLVGYASVFNARARIGEFNETIQPGAFRASLASGADVLALVDHDPSRLLARTKSGTLRLTEDARGLAFELSVPNTTLGADVLAMVERGDVGGASFGFRVTDEAWPSRTEREIRSVDLAEISVVHAHPAYTQTTVSARARQTISERKYLLPAARLRSSSVEISERKSLLPAARSNNSVLNYLDPAVRRRLLAVL